MKAEKSGVALRIQFSDITVEAFTTKLNELLNNPKYFNKAKEISRVFRDNPIHPMDTSMFYIEYVMRHKGAKYFKSAAIELNWYQNMMLDVYVAFVSILIATVLIVAFIFKRIFKLISKETKQKKS